jgi:hypothetical protein
VFVRNPGYAEQLARWGLNEVNAALAFPAQVGLPPAAPAWQRLSGAAIPPPGPEDEITPAKEMTYRLTNSADEPAWRSRPLLLRQRRFDPPTWRYLLRASRATHESANLRRLDALGIPCPPVVAVGQLRQPAGPPTKLFFTLATIAFIIGLATWLVGDLFSWFAGPRMGLLVSKAVAKPIAHMLDIGALVMAVSGASIAAGLAVVALLRWINRDYFVGEAMILAATEPGESLQSFARSRWNASASTAPANLPGQPAQFVEPSLRDRQVRKLSHRLAGQLAAAHRARFIHRDLKFANLQVCWPKGDANGESVSAYSDSAELNALTGTLRADEFVVTPSGVSSLRLIWSACPRGGRRWLPLPGALRRGRIADLARLDRDGLAVLRASERLRFLHAYLRNLGGESADRGWKSIARRVLAANEQYLPVRPRKARPRPVRIKPVSSQTTLFPLAVPQEGKEPPAPKRAATKRPVKRKRKKAQ